MSGRTLGNSLLVACAVASTGCSNFLGGVAGSGVQASETRKISDHFTIIRDNASANLNVTVGPAPSVKIEGDDNIVPLIKTEITDGQLVIKAKKAIHPNRKLLVTVTVPRLDEVSLDGAGNVRVVGIKGDHFKVSMDGAGNIQLGGETKALSASVDGAGNLRLVNLKSSDASVSVDGAGSVELWATKTLAASIDGVGNVKYKGDPQVTKAIQGVGKVDRF